MLTFGHGRLDPEQLAALVTGAGIELVVDIRRFPGSRANPAAARGIVPEILHRHGVDYRWDERLGGRRRLSRAEDERSPDQWWRVAAFRAYCAWTRSEDFRAGMTRLAAEARERTTAIMCSEAVWWRCHRRIVADVALLEHRLAVSHLMHDGRISAHQPSAGVRLDDSGHSVWDVLDDTSRPEPPTVTDSR